MDTWAEGWPAGSPQVVFALWSQPHAVQVRPGGLPPAGDNNGVRGQLVQQAYLGDLQDLRITLPGGLEVRALVASGQHYRIGEEVVVQLPQEACRLVRP